MPKKTANQLRTELRDSLLNEFIKWRNDLGDDARQTKGNKFMFPIVDADGDELFAEVTIAIPTGSRDSETPYNGFEEAEGYADEKAEKEQKRAEKEAEHQRKVAEAKAKREERQRKKAEEEAAKKTGE